MISHLMPPSGYDHLLKTFLLKESEKMIQHRKKRNTENMENNLFDDI